MPRLLSFAALLAVALSARAQAPSPVAEFLAREIIGPRRSLAEVQEFVEPRIPRVPKATTAAEWHKEAKRLRESVLKDVIFRGGAAGWRDAKCKVEWLDTIAGGPGYKIKKLRYEAVPGLWVPALLYEPEKLDGKVPVSLAVNGHDRNGKAAGYKQIRCINMAKRGMIVLNVEWLGMGQLATPGFRHSCMNQLDLCGTGGIAPFYLAMSRGIDILLSHPNADPKRLAVSGLSGGGWQTIFISGLDPRVTLANPVAGYSGFRTRLRHFKDLGDSEQTPCDLATVADYTHLTAMMAPRPTLLTYNAKDDCCFEAGYALPPLLEAAGPFFKRYNKEKSLRSHVNQVPGTHNFEKDNREALYRMLGDFFFPGDKNYSPAEIPCDKEVKSKDDLNVPLPTPNADFQTLALALAKNLPRDGSLPKDRDAALKWQKDRRALLRSVVKAKDYKAQPKERERLEKGGVKATFRTLRLGDDWTVPVVELVKGEPKGTVIVIHDGGRKAASAEVERLLGAGKRVLAVDLLYFGEAKLAERDFLFALMLATVGERPLGLQASQLAAAARWAAGEFKGRPVTVAAFGPRMCTVALVAAGLETEAIGALELSEPLGTLKELIEQNRGVNEMPELFCFGLLERFDVPHLAALAAPRPVTLTKAGPRAKKELVGLKAWYATLGKDFEPLR